MNKLMNMLGLPVTSFLNTIPYCGWVYELTADNDLPEDKRRIHYTFHSNGLELVSDSSGVLVSIFLFSERYGGFQERLSGVNFTLSRKEVREKFGQPSASGEPSYDPILGKNGAWDRFDTFEASLHFGYFPQKDQIESITLMTISERPLA